MPIVDFHTHIFPPEVRARREAFCALDAGFGLLYANPKSQLVEAEDAIREMDAAGVDRAVVLGFGWSDSAHCRDHNDYLADAVRRYPARFTAFGGIQPRDTIRAVSEVDRFARLGLRGIGELMPHLQGYRLDDVGLIAPIAEAAIESGLVLLTHASEPVGHAYPGKGDVTPQTIVSLAERWPDLRIVASHWGGGLPFYALMPEVGRVLRNVYFDSAASTYLYRPEIFRIVCELVGSDRVLFGTDYPLLRPGPLLRKVRALDLSESARERILGGNAVHLLGIEPVEAASVPA